MNIDQFRFRYWDEIQENMGEVEDLNYSNQYIHIGFTIGNDYFTADDSDFLMQCTGLKDKNGELIYEGDYLGISIQEDNLSLEVDKHRHLLTLDICRNFEIIGHKFDGNKYE